MSQGGWVGWGGGSHRSVLHVVQWCFSLSLSLLLAVSLRGKAQKSFAFCPVEVFFLFFLPPPPPVFQPFSSMVRMGRMSRKCCACCPVAIFLFFFLPVFQNCTGWPEWVGQGNDGVCVCCSVVVFCCWSWEASWSLLWTWWSRTRSKKYVKIRLEWVVNPLSSTLKIKKKKKKERRRRTKKRVTYWILTSGHPVNLTGSLQDERQTL